MFDKIFEFEETLSKFTGAPYTIATDCCTHAIELCFRYLNITETHFTPYTYLSVPMLMKKLNVKYYHNDEQWIGEYQFHNTPVYDSARRLEKDMYLPNTFQCLSFGFDKPLNIGRGGAILTDNKEAYLKLKKMCYDGRDLKISPWQNQKTFELGYHYKMIPEEAEKGLVLLSNFKGERQDRQYPDLRQIDIL